MNHDDTTGTTRSALGVFFVVNVVVVFGAQAGVEAFETAWWFAAALRGWWLRRILRIVTVHGATSTRLRPRSFAS